MSITMYANCQDLAGSWDAWHEPEYTVEQWGQWFKVFSEEGIAAQTRQRLRGKEPSMIEQEIDKDKAGL
jgi:hypothetical protein